MFELYSVDTEDGVAYFECYLSWSDEVPYPASARVSKQVEAAQRRTRVGIMDLATVLSLILAVSSEGDKGPASASRIEIVRITVECERGVRWDCRNGVVMGRASQVQIPRRS